MLKTIFALTPIAASLVCACATAVPPSAKAAEVERIQCDSGPTGADDIHLLQSAAVIRSEPLYSHVITGNNGFEERVDGAKLIIRPPAGVSAERMTRIIQCHSARALLGQADRANFVDDPFWLPDTWVTVEVTPENGNYAVTLEANDVPTNIRLAARARAFADAHPFGAPVVQ
jgi:hypothetical protein